MAFFEDEAACGDSSWGSFRFLEDLAVVAVAVAVGDIREALKAEGEGWPLSSKRQSKNLGSANFVQPQLE